MGVKIRFERGAWWVFIHHRGQRWKRRIGTDKQAAREVMRLMQKQLARG